MDIRSAFPSKYLKAGDLSGREVTAYISSVSMETVGQGAKADTRPIVYFHGKKKGLALNKTNGNRIAEVYGWDTAAWSGKAIVIYETTTEFAGQTVDCLRVRIPTGSELRSEAGEEPPEEEPPPPPEPSPSADADDVPF